VRPPVTTRFGAPAGAVEAFIEVPFDVGDTTLYPELDEVTEAGVPPALVSTSLSSQDGVELEGMATAGTVVERPDVVQTPDSDSAAPMALPYQRASPSPTQRSYDSVTSAGV